ncbi:MAG: glycosyltransferase, partial [Acinetobacter sp.]
MNKTYAETLQFRQQEVPDHFKFYFKQKKQNITTHSENLIRDLTKPRLKIAIVTETWPPEINGVALSLLQLCKGLQNQGHKILLIRPEQKHKCHDFSPNRECLVNGQSIPKYPDMKFGWPQYLKVSQAISSFAPDVVHIVTEGPLGFTALHAAKSRQIPVSSGFHSQFQEFSRFFDLAFLVRP